MNKRIGILVFAAALLTGACAPAMAVETYGDIAYVSKYVWRGFDLAPQNDSAIQGGVYLNWKSGMTFNVWGSYNLDSDMQLDELDYTLGYATNLSDNVGLSAGYTHYTFPSFITGAETQVESSEVSLGFSFPKAALKPAITVYEDYEQGDGTYIYLSGSKDFALNLGEQPQVFTFKIGAGYNNGYWAPVSSLTNIDLSLSTTFNSGTVAITPSINYTINQEDAVNTENELWVGVDCGFAL